jgi:hypothetical protein
MRKLFSVYFTHGFLFKISHSYVSELLYIHSKLMIVDDRRVIVCIRTFFVLLLPSRIFFRLDLPISTTVAKRVMATLRLPWWLKTTT